MNGYDESGTREATFGPNFIVEYVDYPNGLPRAWACGDDLETTRERARRERDAYCETRIGGPIGLREVINVADNTTESGYRAPDGHAYCIGCACAGCAAIDAMRAFCAAQRGVGA